MRGVADYGRYSIVSGGQRMIRDELRRGQQESGVSNTEEGEGGIWLCLQTDSAERKLG